VQPARSLQLMICGDNSRLADNLKRLLHNDEDAEEETEALNGCQCLRFQGVRCQQDHEMSERHVAVKRCF
jgi:hypothetical protein